MENQLSQVSNSVPNNISSPCISQAFNSSVTQSIQQPRVSTNQQVANNMENNRARSDYHVLRVFLDDKHKKEFKIKPHQPLGNLMRKFCEVKDLDIRHMRFTYNGQNISGSDTVSKCRMKRRDKIIVCFKESFRASMTDADWAEHCRRFGIYTLKVVLDDNSVTGFNIKPHQNLGKLMRRFCEGKDLDIRHMRFRYDGQNINGSDTPNKLRMKMRDTIHVHACRLTMSNDEWNAYCRRFWKDPVTGRKQQPYFEM